jgi:hypothetical protein
MATGKEGFLANSWLVKVMFVSCLSKQIQPSPRLEGLLVVYKPTVDYWLKSIIFNTICQSTLQSDNV